MAGEWIKMRVHISTDPKVIAIARLIAGDREFMDWLSDPVQRKCSDSALEHVTLDCVTRIVTAALILFWGEANNSGEMVGDDLHLRYADRYTVDAISNLPGLGEAMESVGWIVVDSEKECLILPRFGIHNIPADERKKALNADRQRRFRERHKGVTESSPEPLRSALQSNATEQNRTVLKTPLKPPQGGAAAPAANRGRGRPRTLSQAEAGAAMASVLAGGEPGQGNGGAA